MKNDISTMLGSWVTTAGQKNVLTSNKSNGKFINKWLWSHDVIYYPVLLPATSIKTKNMFKIQIFYNPKTHTYFFVNSSIKKQPSRIARKKIASSLRIIYLNYKKKTNKIAKNNLLQWGFLRILFIQGMGFSNTSWGIDCEIISGCLHF